MGTTMLLQLVAKSKHKQIWHSVLGFGSTEHRICSMKQRSDCNSLIHSVVLFGRYALSLNFYLFK